MLTPLRENELEVQGSEDSSKSHFSYVKIPSLNDIPETEEYV